MTYDDWLQQARDNPDKLTLLACADWLEERGFDDMSYAWRWMAAKKKFPVIMSVPGAWNRRADVMEDEFWHWGPMQGKKTRQRHRIHRSVFSVFKRANNHMGMEFYKHLADAIEALTKALAAGRKEFSLDS